MGAGLGPGDIKVKSRGIKSISRYLQYNGMETTIRVRTGAIILILSSIQYTLGHKVTQ